MNYKTILEKLNLALPEFFRTVIKYDGSQEFDDPEIKRFYEVTKFLLEQLQLKTRLVWHDLYYSYIETDASDGYSYGECFIRYGMENIRKTMETEESIIGFDHSRFEDEELFRKFLMNIDIFYHDGHYHSELGLLGKAMSFIAYTQDPDSVTSYIINNVKGVDQKTRRWFYEKNFKVLTKIIRFLLSCVTRCDIEIDDEFMDALVQRIFKRFRKHDKISGKNEEHMDKAIAKTLMEKYSKSTEIDEVKRIVKTLFKSDEI